MARKRYDKLTYEDKVRIGAGRLKPGENRDDVLIADQLRGSNDNYDESNSMHRAKKGYMLNRDYNTEEYRKMLEAEKNQETFLEDIQRIKDFERRNDVDIEDVSLMSEKEGQDLNWVKDKDGFKSQETIPSGERINFDKDKFKMFQDSTKPEFEKKDKEVFQKTKKRLL